MKDITDFKREYPDIDCCLTDERDVFILIGGLKEDNPEAYLTAASSYLMEDDDYSDYIEEYRDNPWVRVLITNLDNFTKREDEDDKYTLYYRDLPGRNVYGQRCKISILVGGVGKVNPNSYMDAMVYDYIGSEGHNTFIDASLTNPCVRVIITGINELSYV